jgi:hypothetical protein
LGILPADRHSALVLFDDRARDRVEVDFDALAFLVASVHLVAMPLVTLKTLYL